MERKRLMRILKRLDRKCTRILRSLSELRQGMDYNTGSPIDVLHRTARKLREQSRRERDYYRNLTRHNDE